MAGVDIVSHINVDYILILMELTTIFRDCGAIGVENGGVITSPLKDITPSVYYE